MQLNQGQQNTINSAVQFLCSPSESRMIIKGRAGSGKSTLVESLVPKIHGVMSTVNLIMQKTTDVDVHLTATTNKAANVLGKICNSPATTIHSLLGLTVKNDYSSGGSKLIRSGDARVIEDSIIVIDEGFQIDDKLNEFIDKCTKNCKIIFIGDPYQCAPIMQSKSSIENLICRTEELTENMRNKSAISDLAEHWRNIVQTGLFGPYQANDPSVIYTTGTDFKDQIDLEYGNPTIVEGVNKILSWTNEQSVKYSDYVRKLHGRSNSFEIGEYLTINSSLPKKGYCGDSVVQIARLSDEKSYRGITGKYADFTDGNYLFIPNSSIEYKTRLKELAAIKDWQAYYDITENIPDMRSVHGCTVHKGQGSTYKNTFVDLNDIGKCNNPNDVARMMYVATSRSTDKIIFRGKLPAKYGG